MSTSDPTPDRALPARPDVSLDTLSIPGGVPSGLPDPQVLARMAAEFFTALPAVPEDGESFGRYRPSHPPQIPALDGINVTEEGLRALPFTFDKDTAPPDFPGPAPASIPAVPGYVLSDVPSVGSSFSFLESARPMFASIPSRASLPDQLYANKAEVPSQAVPDLSIVSAIPFQGAPTIPSAPRHSEAADRVASLQFLDEVRPLSPVDVVPLLEPVGVESSTFADLGLSSQPFEVSTIRRDFPILQERVNGRPLIWLDNAATTQKPRPVIDRISYFYAHENSNVHRAAHELAARATDAYEAAREKTRRFLNAPSTREIVFVRGATEGINLVAKSWGARHVQKDDEIVITWLEHHANIVPWQMLCAEKGAHLRVAPVDNRGDVLLDEYTKLLGPRTRLVAIPQVSNALGTVTPAREMIKIAHHYGARVLLDGAQAVSHMPVDVQLLDCDFYVFSGHKVFAPTGIGVVYGKLDALAQSPPWQGGGNMIADVTFEKTVYQAPPGRFEAGTGNIADAVGLGAAIDYVERLGMANIASYEHNLITYALESLRPIPGLHLIGAPKEQAGAISFVLDGFRTEDVGAALNREGIAVRAGHHCAQPVLRRFGLESTVRASLAFYNTCEEIDALVAAIWNLKQGRLPGMV